MYSIQQRAEISKKIESLRAEVDRLDKTWDGRGLLTTQLIVHRIKEQIKKGNTITALMLSGHDGGGRFYGDKIFDIALSTRLDDLEKELPLEAKKSINYVGLMGCYAGTRSQAAFLRSFLPNLQVMIGYDGSAPGEQMTVSGGYMENVMSQASALTASSTEVELKKTIDEQIQTLRRYQITGTLFVQTSCGKDFYYARSEGKVSSVDLKNCPERKAAFIERYGSKIKAFFNGDLEIPEDTQQGELRNIYTEFRRIEQCFYTKDDAIAGNVEPRLWLPELPPLSGTQLMMLLFYKNYRLNASVRISEDTKQILFSTFGKTKSYLKLSEKQREPLLQLKALSDTLTKDPTYLARLSRKEVSQLVHQTQIYSDQAITLARKLWSSDPDYSSGIESVAYQGQAILDRMTLYLYELRGPFAWHDAAPVTPRPIERPRTLNQLAGGNP